MSDSRLLCYSWLHSILSISWQVYLAYKILRFSNVPAAVSVSLSARSGSRFAIELKWRRQVIHLWRHGGLRKSRTHSWLRSTCVCSHSFSAFCFHSQIFVVSGTPVLSVLRVYVFTSIVVMSKYCYYSLHLVHNLSELRHIKVHSNKGWII